MVRLDRRSRMHYQSALSKQKGWTMGEVYKKVFISALIVVVMVALMIGVMAAGEFISGWL